MFSKKRPSKKEFLGLFRGIFGNNGNPTKPTLKRSNSITQEAPRDKRSFKKMVKSKIPFLRTGSISRETYSTAQNLDFEDIDVTFNLSSILKAPNSSKSSFKKSLRFTDDITQQTIVDETIITPDDQNKMNDESATNITYAPLLESDKEYYERMKEELLTRNKRAPVKPKRTKSFKTNEEDKATEQDNKAVVHIDERYFYTPGNPNRIDNHNIFGGIDETFLENNLVTSTPFVLDRWNLTQSNMEIKNQEQSTLIPNDAKIHRWINDSTQNYDGNFTSFFGLDEADVYRGKICSIKKSKSNRFDPIANKKDSSCAVALLKDSTADNSRMSWCSVSSY